MERRTSSSIAELLEMVKMGGFSGGGCGHSMGTPACFYANEIGVALNIGSDEEKAEAKEALIELLSSDISTVAGTAFCFLYGFITPQDPEGISPGNEDMDLILTVAEFENNPQNKEVVALAKSTLARKSS